MITLTAVTRLPATAQININPIALTEQQIRRLVAGTTLAGNAPDVPIRIYFDSGGSFTLAVKKTARTQVLTGAWYVEPEADLLCLSIAAGDRGRQCWIVRRSDTIELVSASGSLAPLDLPLGVIRFSLQEAGLKLEFTELLPPPPPRVAPPIYTPPPNPPKPNPPQPHPPIDDFVVRHNRDIYGSDILTSGGQIGIEGLNVADCAAECERTAGCVAFSVDRWAVKCYLKNDITTSLIDARSSVAVRKPRDPPGVSAIGTTIEPMHRRRLYGQLLARRRTPDLRACRESCEVDVRCVGFMFQRRPGQSENCDTFWMLDGFEADNTAEGGYKYQPPN